MVDETARAGSPKFRITNDMSWPHWGMMMDSEGSFIESINGSIDRSRWPVNRLPRANKLAEAAKAFDEAARLAGLAGETAVVKALGARARLEAALARVDGGDATGESALTTLANDESVAETWRGYAMLTLANVAVAKGDLPAATKWLNLMDKRLRKDHVWREYKDSLIRSEPGLLNPVAAPAALPTGK